MIRFLIDKFRQAPGPLKQARLIVSDLAEEVVDLAEHYIKGKSDFAETTESSAFDDTNSSKPASAEAAEGKSRAASAKPATKAAGVDKSRSIDVDPRLAAAIETPGNKRKQEFKVLAILWDTRSRKKGPLSAKAISQHGETIGLKIRHENVRKVIRMRLEKYITVHTEGIGNGTIYRYELDASGLSYFESSYFGAPKGA